MEDDRRQMDLFGRYLDTFERACRDDGMARAEASSGNLVDAAEQIGARFARTRREFTSDDIRRELIGSGMADQIEEASKRNGNRWLGPAMVRLKKAGYIEPTDRTCNTRTHKGVSRIWRSLIYAGVAPAIEREAEEWKTYQRHK